VELSLFLCLEGSLIKETLLRHSQRLAGSASAFGIRLRRVGILECIGLIVDKTYSRCFVGQGGSYLIYRHCSNEMEAAEDGEIFSTRAANKKCHGMPDVSESINLSKSYQERHSNFVEI
jgi:hypothetical protein